MEISVSCAKCSEGLVMATLPDDTTEVKMKINACASCDCNSTDDCSPTEPCHSKAMSKEWNRGWERGFEFGKSSLFHEDKPGPASSGNDVDCLWKGFEQLKWRVDDLEQRAKGGQNERTKEQEQGEEG